MPLEAAGGQSSCLDASNHTHTLERPHCRHICNLQMRGTKPRRCSLAGTGKQHSSRPVKPMATDQKPCLSIKPITEYGKGAKIYVLTELLL